MRRRSIITVGKTSAEIKIYTLRRASGALSYQCAWYDLGKRQTKTFGVVEDAKLFAPQKTVSLQNEGPVPTDASMRDVEILRTCENLASRFGLSVVSAFEEWFAVKTAVSGGSLTEAVRFYTALLHRASCGGHRKDLRESRR